MKHSASISVLFVALLLLIISCSRKDMPQESISPVGNHYEQAMQLCEENRYAEAELILKEGELVAKARDNQLELQKCQGTRYLVARILSATTQRRNYELLHDHERAANMAQLVKLAKELIHHSYEQEKIAELQHQYEQQTSDRRHYQLLAYLFGLLLLVILLVLAILYFNRKRIEQYNSILDYNAKKIERAQRRIEVLSTESEAHDKEISRLNDKITSARRYTNERLGRGKEVLDLILAGGKLPPSADDENCLIDYYSVSHYAVFHEWTTGYNHLTARLYTYLILQDMGKQDDDIARILCVSPSAVRSIKSRVKARKK
ncbi:MAG: hypothetical protein IJ562_03695 [Prevotella sp.]|nr:hypothetical protein [Prevotella sp.]